MTLVEFLRERLAEDEQTARATDGASWRTTSDQDDFSGDALIGYTTLRDDEGSPIADDRDGRMSADDLTHIARHDPARVLRDVEAKREIVMQYERAHDNRRAHPDDLASAGALLALHGVVHLLALPYADHPEFQEEWRVT